MFRGLATAAAAAAWMFASAPHATAQLALPGLGAGPFDASRTTTVKSSKSNTSDRMGGGGGKGSAAKATTVKSSKSNTSDRMGGGGGGKGSAAKATTVKSSKSNTSD